MTMPLSDFRLLYPQFQHTKTDDELIGLFLEQAETEIHRPRWGKLYERGVMALTAHLLALHLRTTENGDNPHRTLASESAGELSVSYAVPISNGTDDFYQSTAYGQEYLRLRKLVNVGVMVA